MEILDPKKLRAARVAAGLRQSEMGDLLGVGKSQISNIENGNSVLDANQLATWCRACRLPNPCPELYTRNGVEQKITREKSSIRASKPLTVQ